MLTAESVLALAPDDSSAKAARALVAPAKWPLLGADDAAVWGECYPDKPVKLILPYPPGGGADQWARIVAGKLEKVLGQPVVFDYRPGASTTIGAEAAARAPADGYTIHLIDSTAFAYVPNMRKVNYDPLKSLMLVAYAKANPGKLTCASAVLGRRRGAVAGRQRPSHQHADLGLCNGRRPLQPWRRRRHHLAPPVPGDRSSGAGRRPALRVRCRTLAQSASAQPHAGGNVRDAHDCRVDRATECRCRTRLAARSA